MSFKEVNDHVRDYYAMRLQRGENVSDIMNSFREDPLDTHLTTTGYSIPSLRRHGQLVGSEYLIKQRETQVPLPKDDIVNVA